MLINATVPAITKEEKPGLEDDYVEGVNLNYTKASIKIGDVISQSVAVTNEDKSANFKVYLKAGKTKMNASFFNAEGEENVVYYVYVEKK